MKIIVRKEIPVDVVDKLFSHDSAQMPFIKFRRCIIEEGNKVSLQSFICLEAIVTDAVYS